MNIIDKNGYIYIEDINKSELDLDKTFNCGQAFRWFRTESNIWYCAINKEIGIIAFKQFNEYIQTNLKYENKDWLIKYLNLDTNYANEIKKLNIEDDVYFNRVYQIGKGIKILRQDLFETIITFICSQNNSMRNIKISVNKIAEKFGKRIKADLFDGTEVTGYTFPTMQELEQVTLEQLRECSVGFRDSYIQGAVQFCAKHPVYINNLHKLNYKSAVDTLKTIKGIGDKVANCICLFSLHHIQAFPIDVHVKRIIDKHYNGNLNINRFGDIAGICQQYMFYSEAVIGGN